MRDHNRAFCRLAAETFDCPGPVVEFGAYQVEGQEGYADLRSLFPGSSYVGCDMRPGPGVDRVEDVSRMTFGDATAGTILCVETFEHVFEVRRAFDEVFRVLRPGGLFLLTSPLNFRIHAYPDDYWRMTPNCLRRMLAPYGGRLVGSQGVESFPHTVMSLAVKGPAPDQFERRARRLADAYQGWLDGEEAARPASDRARRAIAQLYRSKGERRLVSDYSKSRFTVDQGSAAVAMAC